jgi:2'-5' RNA ligase
MEKPAIIYWLIPARDERELFSQIIRILGRELSGPNFRPHLTVLVSAKNRSSPKAVLRGIKARPIQMRILGTATSAKFTKTLFVRFKSSPAFRRLAVDLGTPAKSRRMRVRDPHVSLLYKKISPAIRRELASVIKLPFREVVFDSIEAVKVKLPVRTRADVEAWRVVAKKKLSG